MDERDAIIIELVDELDWHVRAYQRGMAVRALRAIGYSDKNIRGYLAGNVVLEDSAPEVDNQSTGNPVDARTVVCVNCGGTGIASVRNGDDDIPCECQFQQSEQPASNPAHERAGGGGRLWIAT